MTLRGGLGAAMGLSMAAGAAFAHPDGAPWGSADPAAAENCASCHFDAEPINDSPAISMEGTWAAPAFHFVLTFDKPEDAVAGLLAAVVDGDGKLAGSLHTEDAQLETFGAEVRSIAPAKNSGAVQWPREYAIEWRPENDIPETLYLVVAVNAANDDASPFGDRIYFSSFSIRFIEDR